MTNHFRLKKSLTMLISTAILTCSLSACGCDHEWEPATCTEPETCTLCGEIGNSATGHDFEEATCTEPKTCKICGETEGKALRHNYENATCLTPRTCSVCGETQGVALGHDYLDGICVLCGYEDPAYVNLNNFGFLNTYGMNTWIEISGYNLSAGTVTRPKKYNYKTVDFDNGYFQRIDLCIENNVATIDFSDPNTKVCNVIGNDVLEYDGSSGRSPWTITERVVLNDYLIIKTIDAGGMSTHEAWYVPTDLLDLTIVETDEEGNYIINFKK